MNTRDALDASIKGEELVQILEMWGMTRTHAKNILTAALHCVNDNTRPWKDLTQANAEETARFLAGQQETKQ